MKFSIFLLSILYLLPGLSLHLIAGERSFQCQFALALINNDLLRTKSSQTSLLGSSYLGRAKAKELGTPNLFLDNLRASLSKAPEFTFYKNDNNENTKAYFKGTLGLFNSLFTETKVTFQKELERQGRSPEEKRAFLEAFDRLIQQTETMRSEEYLQRSSSMTPHDFSNFVFKQSLKLRNSMAEIIFASTKKDVVCVSCRIIDVFASLLKTPVTNPKLNDFVNALFPTLSDRHLLNGEIDAVTFKDGILNFIEFKFNAPTNKNPNGASLINERATEHEEQLARNSNLLEFLYKKRAVLQRFGISIQTNNKPQFTFAPLIRYQGAGDINIEQRLGKRVSPDVNYIESPILDDSNIANIFINLMSISTTP